MLICTVISFDKTVTLYAVPGSSGLHSKLVRGWMQEQCLLAVVQDEGCLPHDGEARGHDRTAVSNSKTAEVVCARFVASGLTLAYPNGFTTDM